MGIQPVDPERIRVDALRALDEDLGEARLDATGALLPPELHASAELTCREAAVLAGRDWFEACFRLLDPGVRFDWRAGDGARVEAGSLLCVIEGRARALVAGERSALNFLQTLSGTATATAGFAAALAGTGLRLLDTRKTLPGLRHAQKYAVRCGGGHNHRMGLYDAILIKENHIAAAGGIGPAVANARALHPALPLEVEVESLEELDEALAAGVNRIMLDEFDLAGMREAVARTAGRAELEVSGGVEPDQLQAIAATGVDFVSVGALTKHVRAVDLSLRLRTPLPA
jgi:nicotinate-nucleotide pyrophosphorylase (carboxylating)